MCDLGVSERIRNAEDSATVVLRIAAVAGGGDATQIMFWDLLIVGLHWPAGVCWVRSIVLWLGPERSREGLDGVFGPRAANWTNQVAVDDGVSAASCERFLIHIQRIYPPTLSPKFP